MKKAPSRTSLSNIHSQTQKLWRQNANVLHSRGMRCLLSHVVVEFPNSRHMYALRTCFLITVFFWQHCLNMKLYAYQQDIVKKSNKRYQLITCFGMFLALLKDVWKHCVTNSFLIPVLLQQQSYTCTCVNLYIYQHKHVHKYNKMRC